MKTELVNVVKLDIGTGLILASEKNSHPYFVDFLSPSWKVRWKGISRSHIFRKALGVKNLPWRVLDLTAGFGQDTMMAASMGCSVVALERNEIVYTMLREGIERAAQENGTLLEKLNQVTLIQIDAKNFLLSLESRNEISERNFDAIYMDPMFEKPKKSAKSPKEMQLLQGLVGESSEAQEQELLDLSIAHATARVVVKRPLKGKTLKGPLMHSFKGQSIRYDVYRPTP